MSSESKILPKDSLVLVSGANGFIGSHIVDQLLKAGYKVRGTVRDTQKSAWLLEFFDARHGKGKLELVKVEDFTRDGCFDEAVKGVSAFAHVASDLSFKADPKAIVTPAIHSTINALRAASSEPDLKSVVLTSSSTAAVRPVPNKVFNVTDKDWNQEDIDDAWGPAPTPWTVYGASKAQSEQAAWKFVEENKPSFAFNSVLPNANFGEILEPKHQQGSTAGWITAIMSGEWEKIKGIPPQYYVNVVDTALLHVAALTDTSIINQRILAFAEPFNWPRVLEIIRTRRPALADSLPQAEEEGQDKSVVDTSVAERILKEKFGKSWTPIEDALEDNLKGL